MMILCMITAMVESTHAKPRGFALYHSRSGAFSCKGSSTARITPLAIHCATNDRERERQVGVRPPAALVLIETIIMADHADGDNDGGIFIYWGRRASPSACHSRPHR
eukprot:scaffold3919_cov227-Skeletonema_menzelii.AAC.3